MLRVSSVEADTCRVMLIEHGAEKILCDAGAPLRPGEPSRLLASLEALGVRPEEINRVILSQLELPHAGGALLFPRAKYTVTESAWRRATSPHLRDADRFLPELNEALEKSGRLELAGDDVPLDLFDRTLIGSTTHGYTPGELHVVLRDARSIYFAGELVPDCASIDLPIASPLARNAELLVDEKAQLYANAYPGEWLLFLSRDPNAAACGLILDERGRYAAGPVLSELVRFDVSQ